MAMGATLRQTTPTSLNESRISFSESSVLENNRSALMNARAIAIGVIVCVAKATINSFIAIHQSLDLILHSIKSMESFI